MFQKTPPGVETLQLLRTKGLSFLSSIILIAMVVLLAHAGSQAGTVYYTDRVAVLMYHTFNEPTDSNITVTKGQFKDHLYALRAAGFHFITADQFRAWKEGHAAIPPNAVLLTIDDGWPNVATVAAPILKQYRAPSIAFVIYRRIDRSPHHMTTAQVKSLPDSGIEVQSHTWNLHHSIGGKAAAHALHPDDLREDALQARHAHARLFGTPPDMLAYPFGAYNGPFIEAARHAGIRYAFTTQPGLVSRSTPNMELPRINAGEKGLSGHALVQRIIHFVQDSSYYIGGGFYRSRAEATQAAARFTRLTGYRMYVTPHPSLGHGFWIQSGRANGFDWASTLAKRWSRWGIRYIIPAR